MSKIKREEVMAVIGLAFLGIFLAALSWQVLVTNHSRNVERDKFYAEHCKNVTKSGILTNTYQCKDTER